jgi:protease IV
MRQFFKFTFASMLGFLLASVVIMLLFTALIAGLASSSEKEIKVKGNSVLHLDFSQAIVDRSSNNPFENIDFMTFQSSNKQSVNDYLKAIRAAAEDDNIKGIFLDLSSIETDGVLRSTIRKALVDFKASGKFIYAFSEGYTQGTYLMASVADSIFMVPTGDMLFNGLASTPMFFKGMLNKLDIDVKLIRVGKYKGAGEPFIRENLSDENRYQIESFLGSLNDQMLADLSASTGKGTDELQAMANELQIRSASDAVALGMVHRLAFRDEVLSLLAAKTEQKDIEKIAFVTLKDYVSSLPKDLNFKEKNRIAVVYAIGDITSGEGDDQTIGSDRIAAAIRKARLDKEVKAIVLRVNSPGGSALASDIIWREVLLAKGEKPVVVSMGNLAASGGYYIAAAADSIFASPNTLTGSIGVFGMIPNFESFFKNKTGITFDRVTTGKYADLLNTNRPMTADEEAIVQQMVNRIYEDFVKVVADGRGLSTDSVHALAQGRVYTGAQALEIGLVDKLGDLEDAIACAARMAKLETYRLKNLPEQKDQLQMIMESFGAARVSAVEQELGPLYQHYKLAKNLLEGDRIQARLEFDHQYIR